MTATVLVWSDYVCPFAYVGHRRLQRAATAASVDLAAAAAAAVVVRPFELHPETPPEGIARDRTRASAAALGAGRRPGVLGALLAEDGLALDPGPVLFNSRLALGAAEHAREAGTFWAMHDRLFSAAFVEGLDLGRVDVLRALAGEVGLDGGGLVDALREHRHADALVAALEDAMALGITGTPSYRLPDGTVLRGVQAVEVLAAGLAAATRGAG